MCIKKISLLKLNHELQVQYLIHNLYCFHRLDQESIGHFLTIIAPTTSVVVSTATGIREQVDVFSYAERVPLLSILLGLLVAFFLISKINLSFNKSLLVSIYLFVPIILLWIMKIPTIQLDAENQRVFPDPLMPIANSTKLPWTLIWISFVVAYLVGVYFKNKKQFKNAVSISWVLLPLLIFSWIFKKPLIDLNELIRNDIPVFIGFLLIGVKLNLNNLHQLKDLQHLALAKSMS